MLFLNKKYKNNNYQKKISQEASYKDLKSIKQKHSIRKSLYVTLIRFIIETIKNKIKFLRKKNDKKQMIKYIKK